MKLSASTIERAEHRYETKAQAYFYGMLMGICLSAEVILIALIVDGLLN